MNLVSLYPYICLEEWLWSLCYIRNLETVMGKKGHTHHLVLLKIIFLIFQVHLTSSRFSIRKILTAQHW